MKYSIIFLLLGGLTSYVAITLGGWWHVFHWFSVSWFALSAGHAGLGPVIFAKRPDGTIPVWIKVVHCPYMLYSEVIWQLVRLFGRENPTDRVAADLTLGRRLRANELPVGVVNCVDLTAEVEEPKAIRQSTNYINLPILDAGVPTTDALRSAISRLKPGPIFVHCAQGHGRTGLFALVLLVEHGHIQTFEEGMALIQKARPGIGLNGAQEQFVRKHIAQRWTGDDSLGRSKPEK